MAAAKLTLSASTAYGGDLAYYFGLNGNLTGVTLTATQTTLKATGYATAAQAVDAFSAISGGTGLHLASVRPVGTPAVGTPGWPRFRGGFGFRRGGGWGRGALAPWRPGEAGSRATVTDPRLDTRRSTELAVRWNTLHRLLDRETERPVGGTELPVDSASHAWPAVWLAGDEAPHAYRRHGQTARVGKTRE